MTQAKLLSTMQTLHYITDSNPSLKAHDTKSSTQTHRLPLSRGSPASDEDCLLEAGPEYRVMRSSRGIRALPLLVLLVTSGGWETGNTCTIQCPSA